MLPDVLQIWPTSTKPGRLRSNLADFGRILDDLVRTRAAAEQIWAWPPARPNSGAAFDPGRRRRHGPQVFAHNIVSRLGGLESSEALRFRPLASCALARRLLAHIGPMFAKCYRCPDVCQRQEITSTLLPGVMRDLKATTARVQVAGRWLRQKTTSPFSDSVW